MKNFLKNTITIILIINFLFLVASCSAREKTFECEYFSISLDKNYEIVEDNDYALALTNGDVLFTSVILQKGSAEDVFDSADEYLKYSLYQLEHYNCTIETFENEEITYYYTDYYFEYDSAEYKVFVTAYENNFYYLLCSYTVNSNLYDKNLSQIKESALTVTFKNN